MKAKPAIKDMPCGITNSLRPFKLTEKEKELIEKIYRFDILIRKSLAFIPGVLELYETISNLSEALSIETSNNYYLEGFKAGLSMDSQTLRKLLQAILSD